MIALYHLIPTCVISHEKYSSFFFFFFLKRLFTYKISFISININLVRYYIIYNNIAANLCPQLQSQEPQNS